VKPKAPACMASRSSRRMVAISSSVAARSNDASPST
jgi:hypothetical protein